ncbi:MAG TPA: isoprenylcysteine carboxylmethyltransferase family protein [Streptosporangiaceae bacterium]|nr:isoprenylcysteine carboxylmethyltransferase family protein [Streptosporangiaceae bacterium]
MTKPLIFTGGALADVFYAVAALWILYEAVTRMVQRLRAGHRTPVSLSDATIFAAGGGIVASVAVSIELGRHAGVNWPGGRAWPVVVGIVLVAAGLATRLWSVVSLGRFFQYQIEIQTGHRVVTNGPYRYVRHPSYTGMLLVTLGFAFASGDVLSLPATLVLTGLGLAVRIRAEEKQLVAALGSQYEEFAAHHKRLIPGVL